MLTEGYKESLFPKIKVVRAARGAEPLCRKEDQLIALVTDGEWDLGVPCFQLDAVEALVEFLIHECLAGDPPTGMGGRESFDSSVRNVAL